LFSLQLFINLNQPLPEWGPYKAENRTIPRYQRLSAAVPPPYTADPNAVSVNGLSEKDGVGTFDNPTFSPDDDRVYQNTKL
jgi:hypothetical protein